MIAEAVKIYNNERLHWSLELKNTTRSTSQIQPTL
jgi:hypothetical protein